MTLRVDARFHEDERARVARLYWQAFGPKLGKVLGPEPRALRFIERVLNPRFALVAREGDVLLGVAGVKTSQGGLVGGKLADLRAEFGLFGALWRGLFLSLLERDLEPGVCQMDGIFVEPSARGKGVGTALLTAVADLAHSSGARVVRLDVIDTNPRAEALYARQGFEPVSREETGPFRWIFGFKSALRMELPV